MPNLDLSVEGWGDNEDLSSEVFLRVFGMPADLANTLKIAVKEKSANSVVSPKLEELISRDNLNNLSIGLRAAIHGGTVDLADLEPLLERLDYIASHGYPVDGADDSVVREGGKSIFDLSELESLLVKLGQIANQGRAVREDISVKDRIYSETALTGLKTKLAGKTFRSLDDLGKYLNDFAESKELGYVSIGAYQTSAMHNFGQNPQIEIDVANEKYGVTITDDGRIVTFLKVDDYWVLMGFPNMD